MNNFTQLNVSTKKAQYLLEQYQKSSHAILWDCYTTFSREKELAFEYCKQRCYALNGYGFKITSYNTHFFTVGFMFDQVNETTGIIENYMAFITAKNEYLIKL